MRIKYRLPRYIKTESEGGNFLTNRSYTLTISFNIQEDFKKSKKIGFFGIPGKNFGLSYDYNVERFVFEFWTNDNQFHCHQDYNISHDELIDGLTITICYDHKKLKFTLYKNFKLIDRISLKTGLSNEYDTQSIYFGCHNIGAEEDFHKCLTEMELTHFSVFDGVVNIKDIKNFYEESENKLTNDLLCDLDLIKNKNIVEDLSGNEHHLLTYDDADAYFHETKSTLNSVGCGFCLAKWTQVTMHLHNGMTHSCHHPSPHKISKEEIKRNPTALHNTNTKKRARKEMLEGKRPEECGYCWNIEDNSNSFSDRVFKSSEPWSEPYFEDIVNLDWRENYTPKYVEVSFSNTCNFKCAYCGPQFSSKWMEEINNLGGYKLPSMTFNGIQEMEENKSKPYKNSEDNPYVDAFWEWWPKLYNELDTFRITGGEPLLSKDFWLTMDDMIKTENPNRELKLSINSNLGVDDFLIDRLIDKINILINENRVKECIIYTSCDAFGKQAEYIRYGLDFNKLFSNIDKILTKVNRVSIVVMSTFNVFSVFSYQKLISKIYEFKLKHFNRERYWNSAIILDTSYLRYPSFMSFKLLSGFVRKDIFSSMETYMTEKSTFRSLNFHQPQTIDDVGFSLKEIEKITRLKEYFLNESTIDLDNKDSKFFSDKKDLLEFTNEYERRRNLKCVDYFPELIMFFEKIKNQN